MITTLRDERQPDRPVQGDPDCVPGFFLGGVLEGDRGDRKQREDQQRQF
jgi:hypothetical protein